MVDTLAKVLFNVYNGPQVVVPLPHGIFQTGQMVRVTVRAEEVPVEPLRRLEARVNEALQTYRESEAKWPDRITEGRIDALESVLDLIAETLCSP